MLGHITTNKIEEIIVTYSMKTVILPSQSNATA